MKNLVYLFIMVFLATGVNAQIDRTQPKPGPAPKVNLGKPQTFELANGLKVMVVENHKLPRVSMTLSLDNPPFPEGNKKGIDDLAGSLIGNGTSKISKDKFQEEVDFMGARVNFHSAGASASTLSRYFPRVLELMAQGATDPNFTQADFDKEVARFLDGLKAEEKSVASNAQRVENVLVFGKNHPAGEYTTEERLKSLTLADVKAHYANYFVPNNAYLIVMGDVKFNNVKSLVEKNFKNWKKGTIPTSKFDDPKALTKAEINFVDMPNAVQSEIAVLGLSNLKMTDKDYLAAIIANQIYGGDFNSYLNMNLREANGWTYGARSSIRGNKYVGKFKANSQVRNEVTDSAVVEAMKELKRIRTEKVTPEALTTVKASLIGSFVMDAEKPDVIARQALLTQTQSLPADFYETYIQRINDVTVDDVQKAAQKYFSFDNARILVVGKASEVLPALEKLPYKINYFDRFGNSVAKPEQKKVDANLTVKSVMDKYIAAVGGDKTKSVKTAKAIYKGEIQGMKLEIIAINSTEAKSFLDFTMNGQTLQKTVFNGKTGYSIAQGQRADMTTEEIADQKFDAQPFPELTLADKSRVKIGGIEPFNGKETYVVIDGKKKYFYEVASGLKLGSSTEVEGQGVQTTIYDGYKDVQGVKIPENIILNLGAEVTFKLTEVKINEGVSDADFQ